MTNGTQQADPAVGHDDLEGQLADLWGQIEEAALGYAALRGVPPEDAADALAYLFEDLR